MVLDIKDIKTTSFIDIVMKMGGQYYIFFQCTITFLLFCDYVVFGQGPVVNTTLGQVCGLIADDGDYTMFMGIPFGKVREDNPFGEALPHPEYDGIFEANDDSAICPQQEEFNHTIVGTLDCLHLSIFVPNTASPTNLRPVLVWIFGGGFNIGFYGRFLYGPKYLVRHDIVLVTINYRLGPYGYMCLDIPEVPGNQGLKDQLMALKWIQNNIANFGGDPDKVTIAGNSAGSMSVDLHLLRKNDGPKLFQQAVMQSGTSFVPGSADHNIEAPVQLAKHLGFETSDIYEAIEFLSKVDPLAIIKSGLELNVSYGTCVEKEFDNVDAFISEDFRTMTEIPGVKNMPIMIGFNNDELYAAGLDGLTEADQFIVPSFMATVFDFQHPNFNDVAETTQTFYFGDEEINDDQVQNYVDYLGDFMFIHPTIRSLERFLANDVGKAYLYKFSYAGGRNFVKHRENYVGGGAYHADELGYLFDISYMEEPSPEDQKVIDAMTTMWANFVKFADPTPETSELIPYIWDGITRGSPYHYMNIDLELIVGNRPFLERMTYLDLMFNAFNNTETGSNNDEIRKLLKKIRQ